MMILPAQFDATPAQALLDAAERGLIGFDHRLLKSLLSRPEETLAALGGLVAGGREPQLLDLTEQAFDLYRQFRSPAALPFYISLLKRRGDSIPDELVEALADIGAPAVEPLLQLHDECEEDDRADIVFVLATLGVHDERIKALIAGTLARDPYEGALAAGLYCDPSMKAVISEHIAACEDQPQVRAMLEECLEALNQVRTPHQPDEIDIYAMYPEKTAPLFEQIEPQEVLEFFTCGDAEYRARAAMSFCDEEYTDEIRDRLLELARGDADARVRGAAWRALGERIGEEAVRGALMEALKSRRGDRDEWLGALVGLAGASAEPGVHDAMMEAYTEAETRAVALQAMWRSLDSRYKKYIAPNLRSDDMDVRRQAVQAVGALPIPELALELVPLFNDDEVREEAIFSYALAVDHNTTPKSVNKLFDMIADKAGGLSESEEDSLAVALDRRLERAGYEPVYFPPEDHQHGEAAAPEPVRSEKVGRNEPCPCGSGKKYKKCCGA